MARRSAAAPAGRSWLWAQGLACGVLVATAAPLALVLAVLFAPTALAALMASPGTARRQGGILLVYGLAGALPWLQALWHVAQSWPGSLDLLAGMRLPAACWGAQGGAWLFAQLAPFAVRQVLEARVRARIARLEDARRRLREEWGLEEG